MNFHILAESEFPAQLILFGLVVLFSFIKWLFQKITGTGQAKAERDEDVLESLYDSYRETIVQRQSGTNSPQQAEVNDWGDPVVEPLVQTAPEVPVEAAPAIDAYQLDIKNLPKKLEVSAPISVAQKKSKSQSNTSLIRSLQNKSELKKAIILQEILNKPKALR